MNLGLSPDFTMTDVIDEGMAYMGIIPESSWTGPQRLQALVEAMGLTFGEPPAACEHAALPAPAAAAASPAAKGAAEPRTVQAGNADASSSWPFRTKRVRGLCAAVEEVEERERKRRCSVEEADELRKEELRAVKQVIVDAIKAENEDKITKLQLQLVRTQKELEEAKVSCQDAVEDFEDFAKPLQLQNDLLMAKIDALGMVVLLSTAKSLKPDVAQDFGRGMLAVDLKQKDSKKQIAGKAREFLRGLEQPDVLQAGHNFTIKLANTEKKDAIIQKIMESKFL